MTEVKADKKEIIKKIINQQVVEEIRNSEFYRHIHNEFKWIHSMLCLYLYDSVSDRQKFQNIYDHLKDFETQVTWHYKEGIAKSIEKIKVLLGDMYIDYSEINKKNEWVDEYIQDEDIEDIEEAEEEEDEEEEEESKIQVPRFDIEMFKFKLMSKL